MSERLFPIEGQSKKLKYKSQSQKSDVPDVSAFSAKQSSSKKENVAQLTVRLKLLSECAEWIQQRADEYQKKAKNYEVQGRMKLALMAKNIYQHETQREKLYNKQMKIIQRMIDKMLLMSVGVQKKNSGVMKMEKFPKAKSMNNDPINLL